MTTEPDIFEFVERGLFKDAAAAIDDRPDPSRPLQVLRIQLEAHVGSPFKARDSAQSLLSRSLSLTEKAGCCEVVGRVLISVGQSDAGLHSMRRAATLAREANDDRLESRLLARLVEAQLLWVGIEPAAKKNPRPAQGSASCWRRPLACGMAWSGRGDLGATKIQAKRRLLAQASASIETARGLLSGFESVRQQGRIAITSAAIAAFLMQEQWCQAAYRGRVVDQSAGALRQHAFLQDSGHIPGTNGGLLSCSGSRPLKARPHWEPFDRAK